MRDVMEALAELQAAEEAIETAGPLYQTREPLKDKIFRLIGQRSDLITQVLALRRELDAAHARIRELEARAEAAEQERDELSANGAAIVGALEERDMARAERDEARARIRELEAALREAIRLVRVFGGGASRLSELEEALLSLAAEGQGEAPADRPVDYRCQICAAPMDGEAADPCTTHDPEQYGDHCTMHCREAGR